MGAVKSNLISLLEESNLETLAFILLTVPSTDGIGSDIISRAVFFLATVVHANVVLGALVRREITDLDVATRRLRAAWKYDTRQSILDAWVVNEDGRSEGWCNN